MLQREALELNDRFDLNDLLEKEHMFLENADLAKDKFDLPFESQCFSGMDRSGISMLMVMADDLAVRQNRLNLLTALGELIRQIGDISKIQEN